LSTFVGHTDAVWDIRLFPLSISSSQLLGSISADGTVKIWDTETKGSPLKSSWSYHGSDASSATASTGPKQRPVPTGLDFCPTDLKKMVVSYSNSVIKLFDIETGKDILTFKSNETYGKIASLVFVFRGVTGTLSF
jgi:striatin 1/3/4